MSRKQKTTGGNVRTADQDSFNGNDDVSQTDQTDIQPDEGFSQEISQMDDLSDLNVIDQVEEDAPWEGLPDSGSTPDNQPNQGAELENLDLDGSTNVEPDTADGVNAGDLGGSVAELEETADGWTSEDSAALEPEEAAYSMEQLAGEGDELEVFELDGEFELLDEAEPPELEELGDEELILMAEYDDDAGASGDVGQAQSISASSTDVAAAVFNGAPLVHPSAEQKGLAATAADKRLILEPGTMFAGRYQVEEATLVTHLEARYRARDKKTGDTVLLRLILPNVPAIGAFDSASSAMGLLEQVTHRNLLKIRALEKVGDIPCLITDFTEGQTLLQFLENRRSGASNQAISVRAACNMMTHVCTALTAVHVHTVHGRITMESILVSSDGRIMVDGAAIERLLFGPADPPFVSPDQGFDTTADVYALGVILGILLGPNDGTMTLKKIPKEFVRVIGRACADDPADRYGDAAIMRDAILDALESTQQRRAASVGQVQMQRQDAKGRKVQAAPFPGARHRPMPLAAGQGSGAGGQAPPARPGFLGKRLRQRAAGPDEPRWLVSRDGLDYGPFSLNEVTARVKAEEFDTSTVVQDMTTGLRKKILEFPEFEKPLARLLIEREAIKAQNEALRQGKVQQVRKMGIGTLLLLVVGGAAVAGVLAWQIFSAPKPKPLLFSDAVTTLGSAIKAPALPDMESEIRRIREEMRRTADRRTAGARGGAGSDQIPAGEVTWGDDSDFRSTALDFSGGSGGSVPTLNKGLTQDVVNRVVSQRMNNMQSCFQAELRKNSSLRRVELSFWVRSSGEAGGVKVKGAASQTLAKCLEAQVTSLVFPSFAGTAVQITYPFEAE